MSNNTTPKKYPKFVIGAFIFNRKKEILLVNNGKYLTCPNFKVLFGNSIEQTFKEGLKELMNLNISTVRFIDLIEGLEINIGDGDFTHLIFADYKINIENENDFIPGGKFIEREFVWKSPEEWLEVDEKEFGPYILDTIKKLNLK